MIQDIIERLSPLEKRILPFLKNNINLEQLEAETKLDQTEVLRGLQWLENKGVIKISKKAKEVAEIEENGLTYSQNGLPERRFLNAIKNKALNLKDIKEKANLSDEELNVSFGLLKGRGYIDINKGIIIGLSEKGKEIVNRELDEERLLRKLSNEVLVVEELNNSDLKILEQLKKRKKILKTDVVKEISIEVTKLGNDLLKQKMPMEDYLESLTPDIIKGNKWKGKKFRKYDIKANVSRIYPAKRHFTNEAIDYIRRVWLDLGFKEMTGNIIQTEFWNFDALFVPQDHPAREMQDTLFVKGISGKLPDKKIVDAVKKAHESGGNTGSVGWRYKWDEKTAQKLMLRTHTTVLSAEAISKLKETDMPAKLFAVGKVFRNETVDWKHSFEFTQVEGIVVDPHANFRHLLGYLREFYNKLGFDKIRFRPSHFPYTEPSLEVEVWHPVRKEWIELGGAGIFRPEVVKPLLGKDVTVLAWGQGMERSIMDYFNITDFRDLYRNDLKQLRNMKIWMK